MAHQWLCKFGASACDATGRFCSWMGCGCTTGGGGERGGKEGPVGGLVWLMTCIINWSTAHGIVRNDGLGGGGGRKMFCASAN